MQLHLCTIGLSNIAQMERSPFQPDALIRTRGHIIQEMECQPVQVKSTLGYQRGDLCHTDYLLVYLGEEAVYLDAMGMIVTTPVLDQVDCKGIFTPIFQTTDGRLIQANPQVAEVKMAISKPEGLGFHESPLDHMEDTDSLLYTKGEFDAYNEYLHASRARKAIQSALTQKHCASKASCGSYQPSEPGTFNLENLVDDIENKLDWKQWLLTYLQAGGQYASIIVIVVWTIKIGAKLLAVISVRNQGFTWKTALQLNFNLSSQVRDSLLRNAPAPATPEDPGTRPTGTMGTLVLDQHRSTALGEHEVFPSCPQGRVAILSSLSSFLLRQCYNDRVTRENSVPCTRSLARPLSG